jgi:hypothetical protein
VTHSDLTPVGDPSEGDVARDNRFRCSSSVTSFVGSRFPADIVLLAVRWYPREGLLHCDVDELLAGRCRGRGRPRHDLPVGTAPFTPPLIEAARPASTSGSARSSTTTTSTAPARRSPTPATSSRKRSRDANSSSGANSKTTKPNSRNTARCSNNSPTSPSPVHGFAEVEGQRKRLERDLGRKPTTRKLTTNEIKALVGQLKDLVAVLAEAGPQDKQAIYDELGVNLTYHPQTKTVPAGAGAPHVLRVGVGGAIRTLSTRDPWQAWLGAA